ncbi:MAG: autotransporter domain-containing protein [Fusobacterium sp.]
MGKEKRLFLLAVMTVMMSTVGYGKIIGNSGQAFGPNNQAVRIPKETEIPVTNTGDEGYRLNAGDKDKKTTVIHNGKITVNNGKGIVLNVAEKKLGDNILTNNSAGQITINGGIGVELYAENENGGKNTFTNNGKIITNNNAIGIKIGHNGTVTNTEKGTITVNNGTGVIIKNKTSSFINNGKLNINNGKGIELKQGTFINTGVDKGIYITGENSIGINQINGTANNAGLIKSEVGTTAIQLSNGIFNNIENGIIENSGNINVLGGNFNNDGGDIMNSGYINISKKGKFNHSAGKVTNDNQMDIVSSNGGQIGYEISGTGELINNQDKVININSSGKESIGISQKENGKLTNKGEINITASSEKSIGIKLDNNEKGKITIFNNTGAINITASGKNSIGIKVNNGKQKAEFNNKKGTINVNSGVGINVVGKNSTFTNTGTINVNGKDGVGVKTESNSYTSNTGTINAVGGKYAVNAMSGSTFENTGEILSDGTAVTINGSLFVNNGKIETGKDKIAILSNAQSKTNTVYLKNKSEITGIIQGAEKAIDILGFEKGTYSDLTVNNYEALTVRDGNVKIENSTINLEYNKGTEKYLDTANKNMNIFDTPEDATEEEKEKFKNKEVSGNVTMADSTLAINFKDSLTNKEIENPIINVGKDGTLKFEKGMTLVLDSSDGRQKFDIYDALGLDKNNGKIELGGTVDEVFNKTAVWDYYMDSNGRLTAEKESYDNVVSKSQLKDFASLLDKQEIGNTGLGGAIAALETLKTQEAFTNAVTQMSGGVHGYIVDFAALNARTLTNTMRNKALTRDYMRKRPLNSWTQDISYIDNNHRLGGLMNVDYTEKGVLGISEKQILPNGRIGLVYGGSKGNAKFEDGANGSSSLDGAYFGGYYNHEFSDKWSLNSNANFVYTHNKVTRNINITYKDKDKKEIKDPIFKSAYPTYTVGMGTSLIYTVKDDLRNKAHFYAGVDVERIMVGNINENKEQKEDTTGLAVKTTSYNPRTYYSIVPSAGFMVQNTGYVFDRKYRIGADLNWETEVGDIKDGKRLQLTGLDKEYKIETSKRENVFSYSLFGALDLTESLSVNARYTSMFSDEYDADMIGAGFEYKMDTMADNFFGTLAHKLENNRPFSDRWGGTFGLIMETDDVDDYTKYDNGHPTSGDVATSMEYKPKMILSLNDKQSNWSYYFEAYHKTNNMFGSIKSDERESHASRYHGEARWNDTYSKGSYGMSFGYRNENSRKSDYYASNKTREIVKNGTHELRITPSFTYDLGHGFTLGGKSAIVFMYKYEGDRAGQMDMNTESQIGFTYTGFMPRWSIIANFYREDTWYDHSYRKMTKVGNDYFDRAPKNDQVNQLRPSIIYYFGNGASFRFDARIPLGNGSWANLNDGTNGNQAYETRYGFNYYYPVTPGLTVNVGGIFLNNKTKNKDHSGGKYGNITRGYAFRPNIGFYYSF